jgi:transketolase
VIRPADANETAEAWKVAISRRNGPTALALSRQATPTIDREVFASADGVERGAYVLADIGDEKPNLILMASGTEVNLIVEAGVRLAAEGINVRLVSVPSWELFAEQDAEYRNSVLPSNITARVAVEAGITMGWERWVGDRGVVIGIDHFGASAPAPRLFSEFGFTVDHVVEEAGKLVGQDIVDE